MQRWVWMVPIVFAACILLAIDQGGYIDTGAAILAYLVVGGTLIARRHRIEPDAAPAPA